VTGEQTKLDAPFYTDEELDHLYERDPVAALRLSREQHRLQQQLDAGKAADPTAPLPGEADLRAVLEEVRGILLRDGGDIEFVALEGRVLKVRLKGACSGCPRAALDLKQVVERLVRNRYPQVSEVRNTF
jgi:Fe-S cluster biogenesis protein NfuA